MTVMIEDPRQAQWMAALASGDAKRRKRADLKKRLAARTEDATEVLRCPPDYVDTMKIFD